MNALIHIPSGGETPARMTSNEIADDIAELITVGSSIGNSRDERHPVLAHRIRSAKAGVPHLSVAGEE